MRNKLNRCCAVHILPTHAICILTTVIVGATSVAATPLSPFRYEAQAQRHCPDDTVVWLDFRKRYLLPQTAETLRAGRQRELRVPGRSPQQRLPPLVARTSVGRSNKFSRSSILPWKRRANLFFNAANVACQRRPTRLTGPPRFIGVPRRTPTPGAPTPGNAAGARDRPRPQRDARPYDAPGGI